MTSMTTARALKAAGLVWLPGKGDRFVIPDRDMDGDVFVVSDMTVEAQDLSTGQVLGFNGTTEWALDSVEAADVLWLPREGQLREELGPAFRGLRPHAGGWEVTSRRDHGPGAAVEVTTVAADVEEAYALALLGLRGTTAAQLLPVAAGALAALLAPLAPPEWHLAAPDGVRTVADVVSGAVGGLGADPAAAWPSALDGLLQAWGVPGDGTLGAPVEPAVHVAEAGAEGVLVDLVTATWDVGAAVGRRPQLDPATVSRALEHVRTWPSSRAVEHGAGDELDELLRLTGREPLG